MAVKIMRGTKEEYPEIIAFGNMVFEDDFTALLPKLYDNHPELASRHFLVKEKDELCAMAGSFPLSLWVGEQRLKACGIGTVSVHPACRGRGYMQEAMKAALQAAEEEKVDFLCLGGRRQRYEYFGFGKGSSHYRVMVTRFNQKHADREKGITALPLAECMEFLDDCCALQHAQPVSSRRPMESFVEITSSWRCKIYVVLEQGEFLGYASIREKNPLAQEFYLKNDSRGAAAAFALLDAVGGETLEFQLEMYQTALMEKLTRVCEYGFLKEGEMINVLHYPRVLTAFLTLKAQTQELLDGEMVLDIPNRGRYLVAEKENRVSVTETNQDIEI